MARIYWRSKLLSNMPFTSKIMVATSKFTADVTVNPVNWQNVVEFYQTNWTFTTQQITGNNVPVLIRVNYADNVLLHYRLNVAAPNDLNNAAPPNVQGFTAVADNDAFYVLPNYWVTFGVEFNGVNPANDLITVYNQSDNDVQLDQFNAMIM